MRVELPDEYYEFEESVERLLADRSGVGTLRSLWEGGDPDALSLWSALAELGVTGVCVDELHGGAGLPQLAMVPVIEALGRFAVPQPCAESLGVVAPLLAAEPDGERIAGHLARLLSGAEIGAIQDGWSGHAPWAVDCGVILVIDGNEVAVCEPTPDTVVTLEGIDRARRIGRVLPEAEVARLSAPEAQAHLRRRALLVASATLMGLAEAVIWRSVEYAKVRVQFGRPIGSFQAIKHQLADAYAAWEYSRRYLWYAAWTLDEEPDRAAERTVTAKALAGDVATQVSYVGIQVHGGVGYTWECDLHLWLKPIQALDGSLGSSAEHWRALADLLVASPSQAEHVQ